MQRELHSFAKALLVRRICDHCRKVIRFFGYRCRDCSYKCHRKCSLCTSEHCQIGDAQPKQVTCRVAKLWSKHQKDRRLKRPLDFDSLPCRSAGARNFNRSLRPRKYVDAKGKIRQKLINGLYDSFCYHSRHAIEIQCEPHTPAHSAANLPGYNVSGGNHIATKTYLSSQSDLNVDNTRESARYLTSQEVDHFPQSWKRTYSWSSRHSAMASLTSSGYSSMPASCPSSANSHRSTSPTPDFTNIRSITATLERCSLEQDIDLVEKEGDFGCWEKSPPFDRPPKTWPLVRKDIPSQREVTRIFQSADDCLTTERDESTSNIGSSQSYQEYEDDIKKSLREWRIPFSDLQFGDVVGASPKGRVYKGRWHGDIMIHTVRKAAKSDFEDFLKEVSLLSMIRHENVVLFMGACLEPPNLAFITSIRKGLSLHTHLHVRHDFFPLSTRTSIARQIAQGMSYLHAKGIVLPHFNSMNVFLESKVKLCVTAYSGRTTVERHGYASIPRGHLTYIPPEMIRTLRWADDEVVSTEIHSIPTNVYAYGTILYEIMTGRWPFSLHPVESIIWMVGIGTKQCVRNAKCPENIKSLLNQCWSEDTKERPEFSKIVQFFQEEKFPAQTTGKRINGSFSEPEKMHLIGRTGKLTMR